jgi:phage tail sheath gpL-like
MTQTLDSNPVSSNKAQSRNKLSTLFLSLFSISYMMARSYATKASGTITLSSGTGTITATINGVAIAITWATSDTNSAALLATAINASVNVLVADIVTATSAAGVVTIESIRAGLCGNTITIAATGTGATASGVRLTSGTETRQILN